MPPHGEPVGTRGGRHAERRTTSRTRTAFCPSVEQVVEPLAALIRRASEDGAEIVYVNDNYGDWNSSREELAERALAGARPDLVEPLLPPEDAAFVIKARHSIFYGTPLEYLLGQKRI